jgi:hypothetical protein
MTIIRFVPDVEGDLESPAASIVSDAGMNAWGKIFLSLLRERLA